ncbi:hypothetical protein AB0M47_00050 [Hamadaea sp. NPDC051192]|uniref:hypothetical protein n=1 Tax=Hamadaea sp. NPDC051192 TaxID=3154940 RepID=UPI00341389A2
MSKRWLAPIASAAGVAAALGFTLAAAPAQAHDTPTAPYDAVLHAAHHNRYANTFSRDCGDVGRISANQDGWVFNSPSDHFDTTIGMWAKFRKTDGTEVTVKIPDATDAYQDGFGPNDKNTHLAWVVVPAGWLLLDAEAKTVGDQDRIVVTHTCAAGGTQSQSPSPESSETPTPGESGTPTPGTSESTQPGGGEETPSPSSSTSPGLPVTGVAWGATVLTAVGLIAAGIALVAVRRRRELTEEAS